MTETEMFLTSEQYRKLAQDSGLNGLMRELFTPITTAEECRRLHEKADAVRQGILELQPTIFNKVTTGVLKSVPLRFVRDTYTRTGITYLRWRNYANTKNGNAAWQSLMDDVNQPEIIRTSLAQVETTRLVLNMQLGIISSVLEKLEKTGKELERVEKSLLRNG